MPHSQYATSTYSARNLLVRFSHRRRFTRAVALLDPSPGDRILDIGAGDGHLLSLCLARCQDAHYTGLDPFKCNPELGEGRINWVRSENELDVTRKFNKISCFEVLEHLNSSAIDEVISVINTRLESKGSFIVSVPIEIGPPSVVKNFNALLTGRLRKGITLSSIVWSMMGLTDRIPRSGDHVGHIGFDHRRLLKRLLCINGLVLDSAAASPFPVLPNWMNAQIFWVFRRVL